MDERGVSGDLHGGKVTTSITCTSQLAQELGQARQFCVQMRQHYPPVIQRIRVPDTPRRIPQVHAHHRKTGLSVFRTALS